MTRRFYTDPLASIWMNKHFGMRLQPEPDEDPLAEFDFALLLAEADEQFIEKHYVHPDSLNLLEPKPGDHCVIDNERIEQCNAPASEQQIGGSQRLVILLDGSYRLRTEVKRVIQRDGKAFHWPESESEAA